MAQNNKDFAIAMMGEFRAGYMLGYCHATKQQPTEKLWKKIWKACKKDWGVHLSLNIENSKSRTKKRAGSLKKTSARLPTQELKGGKE